MDEQRMAKMGDEIDNKWRGLLWQSCIWMDGFEAALSATGITVKAARQCDTNFVEWNGNFLFIFGQGINVVAAALTWCNRWGTSGDALVS